jgi:hypothetical protein
MKLLFLIFVLIVTASCDFSPNESLGDGYFVTVTSGSTRFLVKNSEILVEDYILDYFYTDKFIGIARLPYVEYRCWFLLDGKRQFYDSGYFDNRLEYILLDKPTGRYQRFDTYEEFHQVFGGRFEFEIDGEHMTRLLDQPRDARIGTDFCIKNGSAY